MRSFLLAALLLALVAAPARAQSSGASQSTTVEGWTVTVYPVLAWIPTHIGIDLNLPDGGDNGGSGGGGEGGGIHGEVIDTNFDGAYLGGFSAAKADWRFDVDGLWAAVGGDRPARPQLSVDTDIIYGHGTVGRRVFKPLFVTAGVRRMAIKYDIRLGSFGPFARKPGVWDPVVGVAFHHVRRIVEVHGGFEIGGFGVGSDSEESAMLRADFKPIRHFGVTAGYSYLHFKVSDTLLGKTLIARQTLHGPVVGVGLYF